MFLKTMEKGNINSSAGSNKIPDRVELIYKVIPNPVLV